MRMLIFLLALVAAAPLRAQDVEVELVLLADSSGSIDAEEIRFQRQGYADAITDPRVVETITSTAYGRIALTYVEWAREGQEDVVVPWTIIAGPEDAARFAEALIVPPRRAFGRNSIGSALLTGKRLIEENHIEGWRKVIDISGDSANNWNGPSIEEARAEVLAAGIVINGLPILCRDCLVPWSDDGLEREYEERIIGGPGSFVVAATGPEDFADAVRRKLILEIGGRMPGTDVARR
ncbi:DUF1194 domain-containing protein [Tranquillimonas alkanivorans]|uniref:VWFA domain-containing protein n=1 Tax=Tranquillimonas alkanivorans TaxID=441119 RepID=A0A1I5N6H9_9RHOB|nr:DUF1194 domain-containing protein [Tranquillimonas alkanivorans]SFP17479.1 Protein of unknown function [Tranquillimonas alkanivorans]